MTLRVFSTSVGTIGSDVNRDSMTQKITKNMALKIIGVIGITGEARLNNRRNIESAKKNAPA
jgi:plasmid maintenance system antidote protein VapI